MCAIYNQALTIMRIRLHALSFLALSITLPIAANDWPQWRGPQRNGISQETGLLQQWPKDGPKIDWKVSDIGRGYSAPAVVGGRLYVLGNDGLENELVEALDVKDGKRLWMAHL